jgi:hypothetical protein
MLPVAASTALCALSNAACAELLFPIGSWTPTPSFSGEKQQQPGRQPRKKKGKVYLQQN